MSEKEVFNQSVSEEEMNSVAGGEGEQNLTCVDQLVRNIYAGGFPNCASTVEDGSECWTNDACIADAVDYQGMKVCMRAWT